MKNQTNKPKTSITRNEAQSFLDGNADKATVRKIEESISENGMEAEAFEGLSCDPSALDILPRQFTRVSAGANGKGSIYKWLFWPTLAVAVVAVLFVALPGQKEKTQPIVALHNNAHMEQPTDPKEEQISIEEAEPIEEKEQITYARAKADQPKTIIAVAETENKSNVVSHEPVKNVEPLKAEDIVTVKEEKVARSNVKFTYMNDLKVVDYSELYTSDIKKTEIVLTGTPANVGEGNTASAEPEIRTVLIPYEKFLKECMEQFSNNQFKQALKNYLIILQHYPDDLNAHFYGGLCYYNLGKFDKAITYFDKCIFNAFSTFEEEAEWYKALSLSKQNKKQEAREQLQLIVNKKGFYSTKAEKALSDIR